MKKITRILNWYFGIVLIAIGLGFLLDVKLAITIALSAMLLVAYIIYKEKIGQELIVAFLIALAWTSYYVYEYTSANFLLGRINIFTLVAWTFGLVLLREIFERAGKYRWPKIIVLYIILLLAVEYIGYYFFGIRLDSNYPSLLGLGVLHAPILMKIFYLTVGPIYLLITEYLKLK